MQVLFAELYGTAIITPWVVWLTYLVSTPPWRKPTVAIISSSDHAPCMTPRPKPQSNTTMCRPGSRHIGQLIQALFALTAKGKATLRRETPHPTTCGSHRPRSRPGRWPKSR